MTFRFASPIALPDSAASVTLATLPLRIGTAGASRAKPKHSCRRLLSGRKTMKVPPRFSIKSSSTGPCAVPTPSSNCADVGLFAGSALTVRASNWPLCALPISNCVFSTLWDPKLPIFTSARHRLVKQSPGTSINKKGRGFTMLPKPCFRLSALTGLFGKRKDMLDFERTRTDRKDSPRERVAIPVGMLRHPPDCPIHQSHRRYSVGIFVFNERLKDIPPGSAGQLYILAFQVPPLGRSHTRTVR